MTFYFPLLASSPLFPAFGERMPLVPPPLHSDGRGTIGTSIIPAEALRLSLEGGISHMTSGIDTPPLRVDQSFDFISSSDSDNDFSAIKSDDSLFSNEDEGLKVPILNKTKKNTQRSRSSRRRTKVRLIQPLIRCFTP